MKLETRIGIEIKSMLNVLQTIDLLVEKGIDADWDNPEHKTVRKDAGQILDFYLSLKQDNYVYTNNDINTHKSQHILTIKTIEDIIEKSSNKKEQAIKISKNVIITILDNNQFTGQHYIGHYKSTDKGYSQVPWYDEIKFDIERNESSLTFNSLEVLSYRDGEFEKVDIT